VVRRRRGGAPVAAAGADRSAFRDHYLRGLNSVARNNAIAYGYSLTITASYGMLAVLGHRPTVWRIFAFIAGAGAAFALANAAVTKGYRETQEPEAPLVRALGSSFGIVSSSAGVAACALVGWALDGWFPWLLGPLVATLAYVLLAGLEIALARVAQLQAGPDDFEER
jgi:hypothetical protein